MRIPGKIFFTVVLLFFSLKGMAQVGMQLSYVRPSKDLGFVFSPALSPELTYLSDMYEQFKYGISLGYFSLKPRQDTIPSYIIMNGTTMIPSYEVWSRFQNIYLSILMDYKILDKSFSPVLGMDVQLSMNSYNYYTGMMHFTGGSAAIGIVPRIGFSHELNDYFVISGGFGKNLSVDTELGGLSYWKSYVGLTYYFD